LSIFAGKTMWRPGSPRVRYSSSPIADHTRVWRRMPVVAPVRHIQQHTALKDFMPAEY
jgi:hypothetical protein